MSRADHPSGNRRGGVCIYYKESLPIKMLNINYLQECICFDLKIGSKLCTIVSLYRSPSQSADEFDNFLNKLNLTMESITQNNPFLTVVIGDFNGRKNVITEKYNLKIFLLPRMKDIFGIIIMQILI